MFRRMSKVRIGQVLINGVPMENWGDIKDAIAIAKRVESILRCDGISGEFDISMRVDRRVKEK